MKTTMITLVIALFTTMGMQAQKAMDQFEIQVDGLGCPFCAYGLEKKFKEFKGIKKVAIDIETGDFSFQYPAEKALTMDDITKQVEKAGYTPITSKITRANGSVETSKANNTELSATSEIVTQKILVAGKCGMCEARIEKASNGILGVTEASWKEEQNMLEVTFDKSQTTLDAIQKAVAQAGHDTKAHKATKQAYKDLPACCKYQRLQ
ncbi:copper chaperone [Dokdonia sinensis]|uniref:Copper chaperone n=1 Tax=Dokdonia sinensis TaxID=2479847 RepID=A0A3M0FX83_9FLAO|nr:heavy-metal-associated domain-containing protein [Dokdonia sinensis]RMB57115.1 copper chaperone [Dokdonia sinensis]